MKASRRRATGSLDVKEVLDAVADPKASPRVAGVLRAQAAAVLGTMTMCSDGRDRFYRRSAAGDRPLPTCEELLKPLQLLLTRAESLKRPASRMSRDSGKSDGPSPSGGRPRDRR